MQIKTCEPKTVSAIPIKILLNRIVKFAECYPDALVAMNERDLCIDFYKKHSKSPTNPNYEHIAQLLWE